LFYYHRFLITFLVFSTHRTGNSAAFSRFSSILNLCYWIWLPHTLLPHGNQWLLHDSGLWLEDMSILTNTNIIRTVLFCSKSFSTFATEGFQILYTYHSFLLHVLELTANFRHGSYFLNCSFIIILFYFCFILAFSSAYCGCFCAIISDNPNKDMHIIQCVSSL
jgi:hypothetical protein